MKRSIGVIGALTLGLGLALTAPTAASADEPTVASGTIYVPDDFVDELSDTRSTGSYELQGSGLHIRTFADDPAASTNKVAEYVARPSLLSAVEEPQLDYTNAGGVAPGFQLVVDFDGNGTVDGTLVGETIYGNDWWVSDKAQEFVRLAAPSKQPGYVSGALGAGSEWHGTLDQWRSAFGKANVLAFGFSLGSGVPGDGVLNSITFAGTRYTFANGPAPVVLSSKDACKNGGWATSTQPSFKNQGDCVSSFASTRSLLSNFKR